MKKILSFTSRKISRALFEYKMVHPGDRVLTAVSGGKDSMILSWYLSRMMKSFPIPFQADFIHIRTEFSHPEEESILQKTFREWGVPLKTLDMKMENSLPRGKNMNCYFCASLRRKTLLNYALDKGYDCLALGHHMDDILESLLMNMVYNSELSVMVPHLLYETGPLRLIRPLALLSESHITEAAQRRGIPDKTCICPLEKKSRRKQVRQALDLMTDNNPALKKNMFESLTRLKTEFLPEGALEKVIKISGRKQ